MRNCQGVVVSGNSTRVGRDDDGDGVCSPDFSFVIENTRECIIKDNVMSSGSMIENIVTEGNNESCIICDNIGSIKN